jgi:hypothetical protein
VFVADISIERFRQHDELCLLRGGFLPARDPPPFHDRRNSASVSLCLYSLGISEQGAAEAFGLSLATYRKYELLGIPKRASTSKLLKFARKYELSLDWLLDGDTSGVRRHLTKGKLAILPAKGPAYRERMKEYHAALFKAELWRRTIMPPECPAPLDSA